MKNFRGCQYYTIQNISFQHKPDRFEITFTAGIGGLPTNQIFHLQTQGMSPTTNLYFLNFIKVWEEFRQ